MRLVQQTLGCSDFDISFGDPRRPSCRALLPEHLDAEGEQFGTLFHVVPGQWDIRPDRTAGAFTVGKAVEIGVELDGSGIEVRVRLSFRNRSTRVWRNVQTNICVALNHLPGDAGHDWCNRDFIPAGVPLERAAQGRWWYETLSPLNYRALRGREWAPLHPSPDAPTADGVPPYRRVLGDAADTSACAAKAPDKDLFLFQAWEAPCHRQAPFAGNACTHLQPVVTAALPPGKTVELRGRIGLFAGDWDSLARHLLSA
jgi:hypothetical protein